MDWRLTGSPQAMRWLGLGLILVYGGQRLIRQAPLGWEPRIMDGALALGAGMVLLVVWATRNRGLEEPVLPLPACDLNPRLSQLGLGVALALAMGAFLLSWLSPSASAAVSGVRLMGMALLVLAGLTRTLRDIGQFLRPKRSRDLVIALALPVGAGLLRLALVDVPAPDFPELAQRSSLTGTLYQALGPESAILLPFLASCLFPLAVWGAARRLADPNGALVVGIMAALSPFQIWNPHHATGASLAPLALLGLVMATLRLGRRRYPADWYWVGMAFALLWMEVPAWRWHFLGVSLLALLHPVLSQRGNDPVALRASALAGGIGLISTLVTLVGLNWSAVPPGTSPTASVGVDLPAASVYWFQPQTLGLPFHITLLSPLEGTLGLAGAILAVLRFPRQPGLALAAGAWWLGAVGSSHSMEQFREWHHLTAALPLALSVLPLSLAAGWLRTQLQAQALPALGHASLWSVGFLVLVQWPGMVMGENPVLLLSDQLRDVQPRETENEAGARLWMPPPQTTRTLDVQGIPAWTARLVWQSEGACHDTLLVPNPRGVMIDTLNGWVHAVGVEPGVMQTFSLARGDPIRTWPAGLREPIELGREPGGRLRVLDAAEGQIRTWDEEAGAWRSVAAGTTLHAPRGMQMLPDGSMLVADTGHSRIVRFGPEGEFETDHWDLPGAHELDQPTDVWAFADVIWTVSPDKSYLRELKSGLQIGGVTRSSTQVGPHLAGLPDGAFLLSDSESGAILHLDREAHAVARVDTGEVVVRPVGLDAAAAAEGELWLAVADAARCRISVWRLPVMPADEGP